ncbi:MAG: DUF6165 family protein [Gammaproteobacteria bacterium]
MTARIEVSYGELVDKITILEIKSERIPDPAKLANVRRELAALRDAWEAIEPGAARDDVSAARAELRRVNAQLWDIEDAIRDHERSGTFDARFIELARSVYVTNDHRARLKKRIDTLLGSRFSEEKSYQPY